MCMCKLNIFLMHAPCRDYKHEPCGLVDGHRHLSVCNIHCMFKYFLCVCGYIAFMLTSIMPATKYRCFICIMYLQYPYYHAELWTSMVCICVCVCECVCVSVCVCVCVIIIIIIIIIKCNTQHTKNILKK